MLFAVLGIIATLVGDDDDDDGGGEARTGTGEQPTEPTAPGEVGVQGSLSVFDVAERDCIELPAGTASTEVLRVDKVDCGQPHDVEIYALVVHPAAPGEPFPGLEAIVAFADNECLARFEGFVGSTFEDSELDVFYLHPQDQSWTLGDREVVCGISTVDGSALEGSVEGSGR